MQDNINVLYSSPTGQTLLFGAIQFRPRYTELHCHRSNPPLCALKLALSSAQPSQPALPLDGSLDQSEASISHGGRHKLINMQVSVQSEGVFALPPERRGAQLHRERNRCSKFRAAIQPGRKPQSHCLPP